MTAVALPDTGSAGSTGPGDHRSSPPSRWAPWRNGVLSAVVIVVVFGWIIAAGSQFQVYVAGSVAILGLAAVGQGWLMGWAGQVSLGGGALFGVGAFAAALTSTVGIGDAFPIPLVAAAVAGAVVGGIVAVPGLRFRGVYLLLATLALQYLVQFGGERIQDAPAYVGGVPISAGFGAAAVDTGRPIVITSVCLLAVAVVVVDRLYRSQAGREWAAIKENELASTAMGIDVRGRKVAAFVGSSVVTALAGGLYAYYIGIVSSDSFDLTLTLQLVVMVFVGGSLLAIGPVLGAAVVTVLPYLLADTIGVAVGGDWYTKNGPFVEKAVFGIALALILLYARGGLSGIQTWIRRSRGQLSRSKRADRRPGPALQVQTVDRVDANIDPQNQNVRLDVSDLSVRYRGSGIAVDNVSFQIADGEIFGLLGRNGAGKSSILKAIGGFPQLERATVRGRIRIGDTDISRMAPDRRTGLGIALVPEQAKVYAALTVRDHFAMVRASEKTIHEALEATGLTMLTERLDAQAGSLSGGERQYLALAVAVLRRPRLLLVDEMSLGLAPIAIATVSRALQQIRDAVGCSVLFVEQNARVAAAIADRIAVLENGAFSWAGLPKDLPESQLEESYLGRRNAAPDAAERSERA